MSVPPDHSIRYALSTCSLGRLIVARSDHGVCAVELGDADDVLIASLRKRFSGRQLAEDAEGMRGDADLVVALIEDPGRGQTPPLDEGGTEFQRLVWEALRRIPRGQTRTYQEVAAAIGRPSATRAVAAACASNRLAVLIPCHRVVRSDGSLSGYRWGVERKRMLLQRESGS